MNRTWKVRWHYSDGDEATRYGQAYFASYYAAQAHIGRIIESRRTLVSIDGPITIDPTGQSRSSLESAERAWARKGGE